MRDAIRIPVAKHPNAMHVLRFCEGMLGLQRGVVELESYHDHWGERYRQEVKRLSTIAGDRLLACEHIGSTAIRGMPAKPILDIIGIVATETDADGLVPLLERHDYEYRSENIDERIFLVKGPPTNRTVYLSLTELGSTFYEKTITFRDYLRDNPDDAAQYAALKKRLANTYPEERERYTAEKDHFIQHILTKAKESSWHSSTSYDNPSSNTAK